MGMYDNPPYYLSAYSLAVKQGFRGSEADWIKSLRGPEGKKGSSAYDVAMGQGFEGTEAEWLESLRGPEGPQGPRGEKPFYVDLGFRVDGSWYADASFDTIRQEYDSGRQVVCRLELDQQFLELPMVKAAGVFTFGAIIGGQEWQAIISPGDGGAAAVTVGSSELSTLHVTVTGSRDPDTGTVTYAADATKDEIAEADAQHRVVECLLSNHRLLLDTVTASAAAFSCLFKNTHHRVTVYSDGNVKYETFQLTMPEDLKPTATDEKYFYITEDGVISLNPAYRGACASAKADYLYGLSDNGVNVDGSRNAELPEEIVIPEIINGIAVKALAKAMFMGNRRVKRLVIPNWVKEIPNHFCYQATSLEAITGTENVTKMGKNAFYYTGIRKAYFPSLTEFVDGSHFMGCANLVVADLGKVFAQANAAVPRRCFSNCEKLEYIRNAEGITSIGEQGLYATYTLSNKDFLPNLESIGNYGMLLSRADCDWDALSGYSSFGVLSTPNHINKYDYSGCTFTPCNNPMRSTFSQHNPLWKDKYIVDYTDGDGNRVYCQYEYGCAYVSAAMVYSALMGVDMESPEEFVEAVRKANPELLKVDIADGKIGTDNSQPDTEYIEMRQWLDAVGLKGTFYSSPSPENVQKVYEALANGALVIVRRLGDYAGGNHHTVIHGVNSKGELLAVDSSAANRAIGIYEAVTFAMPVQNMMRDYEGADITGNITLGYGEDWFMVVTKK